MAAEALPDRTAAMAGLSFAGSAVTMRLTLSGGSSLV